MTENRFFNEMEAGGGAARAPYAEYAQWFSGEDPRDLLRKSAEAETFFRRIGITFNVYGQKEAQERLIPFDIVPRIISGSEWRLLEKGIEQRVRALNAFLADIYGAQEILRSGRLPEQLIARNEAFLPQMMGMVPPGGVYTHIVGTDLVRTGENEFYVLEDNARTPSGVSYMLENRETMLQMFPELFTRMKVRPVSSYPAELRRSLSECAPPNFDGSKPCVAILTPGIHNSAYFEHSFLADQMGAELVESSDLKVVDGKVQMRTTKGYKPIDVIYRRVDDDYLD
uniref:circularly permuted type 2 ATP-grasp protein n=1 Tax=Oceanicola sp. S124 TaxID=1042378 RepID=UPI0002557A4A